jgi:hypothetical protein
MHNKEYKFYRIKMGVITLITSLTSCDLPPLLYGAKIGLSVVGVKVFENRILRNIFRPTKRSCQRKGTKFGWNN